MYHSGQKPSKSVLCVLIHTHTFIDIYRGTSRTAYARIWAQYTLTLGNSTACLDFLLHVSPHFDFPDGMSVWSKNKTKLKKQSWVIFSRLKSLFSWVCKVHLSFHFSSTKRSCLDMSVFLHLCTHTHSHTHTHTHIHIHTHTHTHTYTHMSLCMHAHAYKHMHTHTHTHTHTHMHACICKHAHTQTHTCHNKNMV